MKRAGSKHTGALQTWQKLCRKLCGIWKKCEENLCMWLGIPDAFDVRLVVFSRGLSHVDFASIHTHMLICLMSEYRPRVELLIVPAKRRYLVRVEWSQKGRLIYRKGLTRAKLDLLTSRIVRLQHPWLFLNTDL